jgi:hypothetical protein
VRPTVSVAAIANEGCDLVVRLNIQLEARRAKEFLLLLFLSFLAEDGAARGVEVPESSSIGPENTEDLDGEVAGCVGFICGVKGANVPVVSDLGRISESIRVLVNEDGMGDGDRNDRR